jgi:sialate O-acetylesterase
MAVEGSYAVISFSHVGRGLMAKDGELKGFEIAGADGSFRPASAEIDGDTVVVFNGQVESPVAVRYGWANVPDVNLYNQDGLPASPFSTKPR